MKMMKCGHSANATTTGPDGTKVDCCAICAPRPEAFEAAQAPSLTGRSARCSYCGKLVPSDLNLAFFEHRPAKPTDSYYCGCRGWD